MAAENVKVIVRCRPMNARENALKCKGIVFMDSEKCTCSIVNASDPSALPKGFTFDGVYDAKSTTEQIYNEIAYPLIEGVLEGYNSTVFAYGQTGCGKSFSMQGVPEPPSQRGIIPRAFEHIFESISLAERTKYLILASYLEIYNEEIRDLLSTECRRKLDLKESPDKGVYVTDLSHHAVQNVSDCQRLMDQGWNNRSVGSTLMNADSSRSHSIFCISVENMNVSQTPGCQMESEGPIRRGKLNLVDLAGSERQAKTGATGDRLKEATKINLSLSALGNVISALVDGKAKHIPYRDSKLTRLLQDSLGGNTKTLMVACLSPADNNYDETLSTLRYANRAKNIANKPHINEDPKDTMLREYQEEIRQLRALLESSGSVPLSGGVCMMNSSSAMDSTTPLEKEKLRLEYEAEMEKLREQYNAERNSKSKMEADLQALKEQYQRDMENIGNNNSINTGSTDILSTDPDKEFSSKKPCPDVSAAQQEILKRLQKLQASMVGGERKNDRELQEKKLRKKLTAEKRLKSLAQVLARVDNTDDEMSSSLVLGVYDDIQEELRNKIEALKKQKQKVKALDREIQDLQSEFELERTDYLETIRRLERQNQLHNQIFDKLVPIINKDSNYSNIEQIKQEAVWSEESQSWRLPKVVTLHSKLPPAGSQAAYISASLETLAHAQRWKSNQSGSSSSSHSTSVSNSSPESCASRRGSTDLKVHKDEDIAENYFKPKRATELLKQEEAGNALARWKDLTVKNNKLSPLQGNPNSLPSSFSTLRSSGRSNSVWQSSPNMTNHWINNSVAPSPDLKKPLRLEALPDLKVPDKRRKGSLNLNKMDVL
ncbi:hypothetical protein M8J76_014965 [Diaphorina citri]|nr:hypothetical protein M8J76_014965 [Diaphorina citri]